MLPKTRVIALVTVAVIAMMEFGENNGRDFLQKALPSLTARDDFKCAMNADCIQYCGILHQGLINTHYLFSHGIDKFVYRSSQLCRFVDIELNYTVESKVNELAFQHGIDNTFVYMNKKTGNKISRYLKDSQCLDITERAQCSIAISKLQEFHRIQSAEYEEIKVFNFEAFISLFDSYIHDFACIYCNIYKKLLLQSLNIYHSIAPDLVLSLCHFDCHAGNFLFDSAGNASLIDFEHCKHFDARFDLASLVINCSLHDADAVKIWNLYFGRDLNFIEKSFMWNMCLLCAFYNIQWAIYIMHHGIDAANYLKANVKFILRHEHLYTERLNS